MTEISYEAALPRGLLFSGAPPAIYLCPIGLAARHGDAAAMPLAGGPLGFARAEVLLRWPGRILAVTASVPEIVGWAEGEGEATRTRVVALLDRLSRPRPPFAGLSLDRVRLMGVVNVTPDSFSDGGRYLDPGLAIGHGRALAAAGAEILDIGGESTRPGSAPVTIEDELARVVPVISGLSGAAARLSIDTRNAAVMEEALAAGAAIVNDVSALTHDAPALPIVARWAACVVLMHKRGEPATMQQDPVYDCAPLDVYDYLEARVNATLDAGVTADRIAIDPGYGFGKTVAHNTEIMARLAMLHGLGVPILLGASRKSSIAELSRGESADRRLPGSLALALASVGRGVQLLRVHDVAETAQALAVWQAVQNAS